MTSNMHDSNECPGIILPDSLWSEFIEGTYSTKPRLAAFLKKAKVSLDNNNCIHLSIMMTAAQRQWFQSNIEKDFADSIKSKFACTAVVLSYSDSSTEEQYHSFL